MGWVNCIIIHELKLLVDIPREVDDIDYFYEKAINDAIDENNFDAGEHIEEDDMLTIEDVPIGKITIKDISGLHKRYEIIQKLAGMSRDKLFLFWLKNRGIKYEIASEHNIDFEKYKMNGYTRITW